MPYVSYGERVKAYRELRGLTQLDLSERTRIPPTSISRIETNSRKVTFEEAVSLAEVLQVSLDALAGKPHDTTATLPPEERESYQLFKDFCEKITTVFPPPQKGAKSYSSQKYGTSYQKVHTIVPKWHFV